jgi:hypothetical protein
MRALVVAASGLIGLSGFGLLGVPSAAAAAPKKPAIVALVAAPLQVPAEGGSVTLTVRVRNATRCTFHKQSVAIGSAACVTGRASRVVTIAPNQLQQTVVFRFDVLATGGGGKAMRTISVVQGAAPAPLAAVTTSLPGGTTGTGYTAPLQATGGKPPYTWTLTTGALPSGLTLGATGSISGTPTSSGQFPLTLQVADAAGRTATAQLSLTVKGPVLAVGRMSVSTNWSGYVLDGTGFTYATGTFTVPTVPPNGSTSTAQWIGVDGDSDSNQDLIQAGVAEDVNFGNVQTYAWWEILPAVSTPIDSSVVNVQPGDTVTVTIRQAAAGSWTIQVADVTRNQTFTTTQSYNGPGLSAEWIVEAASDTNSHVLTLGQYSPPVTFTGLGWSGTPTSTGWTPIQMQQPRAGVVSVPSGLNADQTSFVVAYGSSAPATPG